MGREAFEAITAYTAEAIIEDKRVPFPTFSKGGEKLSRKIKPAWGHTEGLQRVYNKVKEDRAFYGIGFEKANGAWHFTAGKFTDYVKDPLISFRMNPVTVLTAPKSGYYLEIEGFRPGAYFVTLVTHQDSMWTTSELEMALKEASTMQPRAAFGWVLGYGSSEQLNVQTAAVYKFPDDRPAPATVVSRRSGCEFQLRNEEPIDLHLGDHEDIRKERSDLDKWAADNERTHIFVMSKHHIICDVNEEWAYVDMARGQVGGDTHHLIRITRLHPKIGVCERGCLDQTEN